MVNDQIVNYIITWLCYGDEEAAQRVAYTADESALETHDVVIVPCGLLGKELVYPELKKPIVEQPTKGKTIIRTDIVYATFFFSSRAEELLNPQRDEHGRFAGKYSFLHEKSRLLIPRLDEYARLVLKQLNLPMPEPGFGHVYLTHDIDTIAQYRSLRGAVGGILRGEGKAVWAALNEIHNDPLYTFPWLIEQDERVPNADAIYFVKHTQGKGFDYPQYPLWGRDYKRLKKLLRHSNAYLGVHGSYYGSIPKIKYSKMYRAHFLRADIDQLQRLVNAGYTDDFTMGYADQVGFRLQTSRAIRWINPKTMQLTTLTLHPLMIMDNTLSNANYMHLDEEEAYFLCERVIDKVRMHHGDLCILWHNSNLTPDKYHKALYEKIIDCIREEYTPA